MREQDAGKTTLARAILEFLNHGGTASGGFKPRAGNSLWYDYDVVSESMRAGRLYGSDAKVLRTASGGGVPEECHSPVHRLWSVSTRISGSGSGLPAFVVDRVAGGGEADSTAVINNAHPRLFGSEGLLRRFFDSCKRVLEVRTTAELSALMPIYDRATDAAHRAIEERYETIVYESYSDVALPWEGIRSLDAVFAVEPGKVHSYEPSRYLKACELTSTLRGDEVSTREIRGLIKDGTTVEMPARRSTEMHPELEAIVPKLLHSQDSNHS